MRQENSYYPFGLMMPGSTVPSAANKNLYNGGSEWQDDFANLPDLQQTFYRMYDAALGRFTAVDPMAEATDSYGTYHYAMDNPVMFNDPMGNTASAKATTTQYLQQFLDLANQRGQNMSFHHDWGNVWIGNDDVRYIFSDRASDFDEGGGGGVTGEITWNDPYGNSSKIGQDDLSGKKKNESTGVSYDRTPDSWKTKLAKALAAKYYINEIQIMSCSILMDVLLEVSTPGEILTGVRESIVDTYGTDNSKITHDVYSAALKLVRQLRTDTGEAISDLAIYKTVGILALKASALQIHNSIIENRIKNLDINVNYDKIDPTARNYDPTAKKNFFGGAGTSGTW